MVDWKCPIDTIEEDIREVVRVLYENNMRPYNSCSGSYKDHTGSPYIPESACVYMLDSDLTRELLALLINDERFKCSISKEKETVFYDNHLPEGLRFKISFENIKGDISSILLQVLQSVINGKKAPKQDREKIDTICDMLNDFPVSKQDSFEINFSFNDELVQHNSNKRDNFSIELRDRKDLKGFYDSFGNELDDFIQDGYSCKFFSSDFVTALALLKKLKIEYTNIPYLGRGQNPQLIQDKTRYNRFTYQYDKKREEAERNLEEAQTSSLFENTFSLDDLLSGFINNDK